jgi:cytochrome P450
MEVIRLYPFFASFTTTAVHDTYIEDLHVPAGTRFSMPLYAISRQENLWGPDAAKFRPERWLEAHNGGAVSSYAFMSFNQGARQCAGKEYAMISVLSLIANLIMGLRYDPVGEHPPPFERGTTLTPVGGLCLKVTAINKE